MRSIYLLIFLVAFSLSASAQEIDYTYTIQVTTADSVAVPGVNLYGNDSFEDLNGRITDNEGHWTFDWRDIKNLSELQVIPHRSGYRFEPSIFSPEKCLERFCEVTAIPTTEDSILVRFSAMDQSGDEVPGVTVMYSGATESCPKETDINGNAYFVVPARDIPSCDDGDADSENNYNRAFASPPTGSVYSLVNTIPRRLCLNTEEEGVVEITVLLKKNSSVQKQALSGDEYAFHVINDEGIEVRASVMLYDRGSYSSLLSNINFERYNITNLGLVSGDKDFLIIPYGPMEFYPSWMTVNAENCPNNRCTFVASSSPNLQRQIGQIDFYNEAEEPVSGIEVTITDSKGCGLSRNLQTTRDGSTYFPYTARSTCNGSNGIRFSPRLSGYSFSQSNGGSFEICPEDTIDTIEVTAQGSQTIDGQHAITGTVTGADGHPVGRASIFVNGVLQATSHELDGTYTIYVDHGETITLTATLDGYTLSPSSAEIMGVYDRTTVDFQIVSSSDGSGSGPGGEPCPIKAQYIISGFVIDEEGNAVEGAPVFNNDIQVATTDVDGSYSFLADRETSLFVTVYYNDKPTNPAGINELLLVCDHTDYNFQFDGEVYLTASGRVTNPDGNPLSNITIQIIQDGEPIQVTTDEDGYYLITIIDGVDGIVTPVIEDSIITPIQYNVSGDMNQPGLDFTIKTDECPEDDSKDEPGQCGCGIADTDTDNDGTANCNDSCPTDNQKSTPGLCGCGTADTDTDGDGAPDCTDECDNDASKVTEGFCGCGVSEDDADGDGTPDCNDQCSADPIKTDPGFCGCGNTEDDCDGDGTPNCVDSCKDDPDKTAPGQCGCGIPDTDADNDGTAECLDLCDEDANKLLPGQCGCGTSDNDSDSDGTANCNDECPNDENKIAPGLCGCGIADEDKDSDGTLLCNDQCDEDPLKIAPGVCGCGVSDNDSDGDGVSDCNDECSLDPNKTGPGQCGCGFEDVDTDNDGTADCVDLCPLDSSKSEAGTCGCGIADTDTDDDGTPDCQDLCPNNDTKTSEGVCGCDTNDVDTDNDGVYDCNDQCIDDPEKSEPGQCGCGEEETDSDNDGIADCKDVCRYDPLPHDLSDDDNDGVLGCNDSCPTDSNKSSPGLCGCGTADTDTDGDETPDCYDGCDSDPDKIVGGICGCGIPDEDSDGDGTYDCNDNCPSDPLKLEPGICGCSVSDADSDNDGTPNCEDSCDNDPNKTEPGVCGCNNVDEDSDGDGTLNCNDLCVDDPNKTAAGKCGCGVPDSDSDGDGVVDCLDLCPNDPEKAKPGYCGCGEVEVDSDNDGVSDCADNCPTDRNKTEPGSCGCGVQDNDSDLDGTYDCHESCPLDPNKIDPGACGCGVSDGDFDGDGTRDCEEECPQDPNKLAPGICGCGLVDTDSDGDGSYDCNDGCDSDPLKSDPGLCGCGVADTDTDLDGVPNCLDQCASDPLKAIPGICGCGISDVDTDVDGVVDCQDGCPEDGSKTAPGACGCGIADTDSDGDGFSDCNDLCIDDPTKTDPGVCGCGTSDIDTDGDGIEDCLDMCPTDPLKLTSPGVCGCGVADTDIDNDGVLDCLDVCPADPNKSDSAGICGCGVVDEDSNGNGQIDCTELAPTFSDVCFDTGDTSPNPEPGMPPEVDLCAEGATEVLANAFGVGVHGAPVADNRRDTSKALGLPQDMDTMNFVSLGKGGFIELGFGGKAVYNRSGFDLRLVETSWGQDGKPCGSYPEFADVYGTQDGLSWHPLGTFCRDAVIDLQAAELDYITAVRIIDTTVMSKSDGYDVDGVACIQGDEQQTGFGIIGELPEEEEDPGDNGLFGNTDMMTGDVPVGGASILADSGALVWSVTNPNDFEVTFYTRYKSEAPEEEVARTVPANSSINFTTPPHFNPVLVISLNGEVIQEITHSMITCGSNTNKAVLNASIRSGRNGSKLSTRDLRRLEQAGTLVLELKSYETGAETSHSFNAPSYMLSEELDTGYYKMRLRNITTGKAKVRVRSRNKNRFEIVKDVMMVLSVRIKRLLRRKRRR